MHIWKNVMFIGILAICTIVFGFYILQRRSTSFKSPSEINFGNLKRKYQKLREKYEVLSRIERNRTISLGSDVAFGSSPSSPVHLWMGIAILTIPRIHRENYLALTVTSLLRHIPLNESDVYRDKLKIYIYNHNKNNARHDNFENLESHHNVVKVNGNSIVASAQTPSLAKQQILDLIWTLKDLQTIKTRYIMLLEDDFTLCQNGFYAIEYVMRKSTFWNPNWIALRVSYGMNGIIMKKSDINLLVFYFESTLNSGKPPDHLFYDFCRRSGRDIMTYRNNLFFHIGKTSTFPNRPPRYSPDCWQTSFDWLQDYERFRNEDCPTEDISPCAYGSAYGQKTYPLIDFDMKPQEICRHHFPLCWDDKIKTLEDSKKAHCRLRN
jgi:hypothetical protein